MSIAALFPTLVVTGRLPASAAGPLNAALLREVRQLHRDDAAGRAWSAANYPGGYTSYGSACRLHRASPTFARLQGLLAGHVRAYTRALRLDLAGRRIEMTDCWVNVMPRGVAHGLHLHPTSTISGTYYVQTPAGSPGLKLEDPRLDRFMAAPPRRAGGASGIWVTLPARAGAFVLFESWLRHEVPVHRGRGVRVSVSFNYGWF